jgi:MOSC domain-containing protein YiiM
VRGTPVDVGWIARHLAHELVHHLHDVGRIRAQLGAGARPQQGTVVHLARSDGGVPKAAQDHLEVDFTGVAGDRQNDRKHHGRPFQALCLWSEDQLGQLRQDGHPIHAGSAGENITVLGIDWPAVRPGAWIRVGAVEAEVSCYATPCAKNDQWFADRDHSRIDQDLHPGWSRLYATVYRPGVIGVGDRFEVEPG